MPENIFDIQDRVVVLTGGSRGLGAAFAKKLAEYGAKVAVLDIEEVGGSAVVAEIKAKGQEAVFIKTNIVNKSEVQVAADKVITEYGRVDVIVNNATSLSRASIVDMDEKEWDKVLAVGPKGAFLCSQAFGPYMIKQGKGKVIHISSIVGFIGMNNRLAYCTSKGAINQMTKAMAIEWAPYHINVNAIAPSYIETELTHSLFEQPDFYQFIMNNTPLKKILHPDDLFGALLFLASSASDMVTGHILSVDGGWVAQ